MDNYFAAAALIADRLREQVPELVGVYEVADLGDVARQNPLTPVVYVAWTGESVPGDERSRAGPVQLVEQHWLVVLAVYAANTDATPRQAAGPLLWQINRTLQGWAPSSDFRPLRKTGAPAPIYEEGFGFFPLAFSTIIVLPGDGA